jgi:CRISPR-associated endonuclease Csn1
MKKKILGLDLGTNSIGWALIEADEKENNGNIVAAGSRIIPMTQDVMGKFDSGQSHSQTAERTGYRGVRRLRERNLLRRERLHRVLNMMGFLPAHFAAEIDFEKRLGQFTHEKEPKIAYKKDDNGKFDFIFKNAFAEMLLEFQNQHDELKDNNLKIPYDWTIYYLRKKALSHKLDKEELAWLILNFNQKRGYYQLRGEEDEINTTQKIEFHALLVTAVEATEDKKGLDIWYNVHLENGWIYRRSSRIALHDWVGKTKEFIVTTDINEDGSEKINKEGTIKRSFRAPKDDDWTLVKKKTEFDINKSGKSIGAYIYDTLLINPKQKIKGKLVRTIERKFYKEELKAILDKQKEFHPELSDAALYTSIIHHLYPYNESHRNNIQNRSFTQLFIDDIIFYQRPLKSKISEIADCTLESRTYVDKNGEKQTAPIKVISKSHPLFQEFRLWQWIQNLKIYQRQAEVNGRLKADVDVTTNFLQTEDDIVKLFDFLNEKKEITQDVLLKYLFEPRKLKPAVVKNEIEKYRWNYVEDKEYPMNKTRYDMVSRLKKCDTIPENFLSKDKELALWHILYSVSDKMEIKKAITKFAKDNNLGDDFIQQFERFPPFDSDYGAFSERAIKKLLPLMRMGKYWDETHIHPQTINRINNIINAEYDETIKNRVREKAINLTDISHFRGLPLWLTSYIVYDRHSESGDLQQWKTIDQLNTFIKEFKQHDLRNPIVEQVILETLRVVKDIWEIYGVKQASFFDEIHIELGREMKNNAADRKKITENVTNNENTNLRIKALMIEMLHDQNVENLRPYSPSQQEILKIYEEGVLAKFSEKELDEEIRKISKMAQPSSSELKRYKLWLEQKYLSPYTGAIIPLNKLFTSAYEIEHIIPQSRYFDDSFSNKVICEAAVNKDKDNLLGLEYIKSKGGSIIELGFGKSIAILTTEQYIEFVQKQFGNIRGKMKKLLMDEIPEGFIERQMNDTRYISKYIKAILSNIVRVEKDDDGVTAKNLLSCNGTITDKLKQDWGINQIWNELITPRFERLNAMTNSNGFGSINVHTGKFLPTVPLAISKGFSKKRIDHRHHAMDAIVIAATTRNHINYLNNQSALDNKDQKLVEKNRMDLKNALCKKIFTDTHGNYKWEFKLPWELFTLDAKQTLENTVVSFKQNLRVINKSVNYYQRWVDDNGKMVKKTEKQTQGDQWAIRKPMHKETIAGLITLTEKKTVTLKQAIANESQIVDKPLRKHIKHLKEQGFDDIKMLKYFKDLNNTWNDVDISKVALYEINNQMVASRTSLDTTFNAKKIKEEIADTGIQKILLNHLASYDIVKADGAIIEQPEIAFTPEGIDDLNKNIVQLNDGKFHQPIFKVRTIEPLGNKFNVGATGNKKDKYVIAATGTNLFFAIYVDSEGKRNFETIQLNTVIERFKEGLTAVPEVNEQGNKLLFHLSPNDLVYVPTEAEKETPNLVDINNMTKDQAKRVYKMVSSGGPQCYFIINSVATTIIDKVEFEKKNKMEKSIDGIMIKANCWKLETNRLGQITKIHQ